MTNASKTFDTGSVYALLNSADETISYLSPHDECETDRVMNALENRTNDLQGIPRAVPMAQAGLRYFALLDNATADMKGRFSATDFDILINAELY